ncbi:MAG: prepilin-type N-terminal cleavage/methylation domain-containing protein [Pseudomonadota bacterium]
MRWNIQPNFLKAKALCRLCAAKMLPERSIVASQNHLYAMRLSVHPTYKQSQGFTLLELLVVVALLGLISAAAVIGLDGVEKDAALQITKTEMIEIRKALRQFKQDVGRFPDTTHPADFSQVTSGSLPDGLVTFSVDTARGWRGPYLTSEGNGSVTVGEDLQADGTGSILAGTSFPELAGVADEFAHLPEANNLLAWRQCTDTANKACEYHSKFGRPYLLFDLEGETPRLVSMGEDGRYDGVNATDACVPNNDDLVVCLK